MIDTNGWRGENVYARLGRPSPSIGYSGNNHRTSICVDLSQWYCNR